MFLTFVINESNDNNPLFFVLLNDTGVVVLQSTFDLHPQPLQDEQQSLCYAARMTPQQQGTC